MDKGTYRTAKAVDRLEGIRVAGLDKFGCYLKVGVDIGRDNIGIELIYCK